MDNFLETLKQVEAFTAENTVSVYCPIAQTTLNFKPLTVTQTKEMIKTRIDTNPDLVEVGTSLANAYNNIVTENCVEGAEAAKKLTIIDREVVLFELRTAADPVYKINDKEIDLSVIQKNITDKKPDKKIISAVKKLKFKTGDVVLKLSIPTLEKDKQLNSALTKLTKDKQLNDILAEVLITEACKYIDSLSFGDTNIEFNSTTSGTDVLNIVQKLPTSVLNAVSNHIAAVKTYRNSLFSVNNELIELGSDFFSSI